jgi:hypothetical protein
LLAPPLLHFLSGQPPQNLSGVDTSIDGGEAAKVYTGFFGLVMMGAFIDGLKQAMSNTTITGDSVDPHGGWEKYAKQIESQPEQALYNALDRSEIMGPFLEGSNILHKMGGFGLQDGLQRARQAATGATLAERKAEGAAQGKMANVNLAGATLGPSFGLLQDAISAAAEARTAGLAYINGDPIPFKRSDFKTAQRILPFGNMPVVQQVINEGQRQTGNIFQWPTPH